MRCDGVQGTLVVERNAEKEDAFVVRGKGLELEVDNESVIEQLAEMDADLLEQRRLFFVDQENDPIDIDDVQLIVFHGKLEVDGKLVSA